MPRLPMKGSTASGLEDAYIAAFWARQRMQWNLYAGEPGPETPHTELDFFRSIDPMSVFPHVIGYSAGRQAVWMNVKGSQLVRLVFAPDRSTSLLQKLTLLLAKKWETTV